MKLPKVIRPDIEIEYKGAFGFLYALFCICRIGIKRMAVDIEFCGEAARKWKFFVIPKYTLTKVERLK